MTYSSLSQALTLDAILSLANDKTFVRGKAYFLGGAVSRLDLSDDDAVRATVRGTYPYTVELRANDDDRLDYDCTCPVGEDGAFCKHAVAVALSWLENTGEEVFRADDKDLPPSSRPRKKRKTYAEQIEAFVKTLDETELRTWLIDATQRDTTLRDKLLFAARTSQADGLTSMKNAVREATSLSRLSGAFDDDAGREYADRLLSLTAILRERLNGPFAAQVVELVEFAIASTEACIDQIQDPDGEIPLALEELASLHLDACVRTHADGVALAGRLFQFQTENPWGTLGSAITSALPEYRDALGEKGLQRYRELAERAWAGLPALSPDDGRRGAHGLLDSRRSALKSVMKALAELDDDIDQLIRIETHDLSGSWNFLQVAHLCEEHGRHDDALAWAQRGLRAFEKEPDRDLLDFCIRAHLRRNEHDQANALAWERFMLWPMSPAVPDLLAVARAGHERDEVYARVLAYFRAQVARQKTAKGKRSVELRTELVKVLLAERVERAEKAKKSEKLADEAWAVFTSGEVLPEVWPDLASARGHTHPHEAIALYHRLLPQAVQGPQHGGAHYDEAFSIVQAIGKLRERAGEHDQFAAELADFRQRWKLKRNFMKRLATLE